MRLASPLLKPPPALQNQQKKPLQQKKLLLWKRLLQSSVDVVANVLRGDGLVAENQEALHHV